MSHVDHTRILEFNLNVKPVEAVSIMKGMVNIENWPSKPNNPDPKQDTTKWCESMQATTTLL